MHLAFTRSPFQDSSTWHFKHFRHFGNDAFLELWEMLRVALTLPPSSHNATLIVRVLSFQHRRKIPKANFVLQRGRESSEVFLVIAFFFKSLQQEWSDWLTIGIPRPSIPNYLSLGEASSGSLGGVTKPLNKNIAQPARTSPFHWCTSRLYK